jgi:hypothetical protein
VKAQLTSLPYCRSSALLVQGKGSEGYQELPRPEEQQRQKRLLLLGRALLKPFDGLAGVGDGHLCLIGREIALWVVIGKIS